MKILRPFTATGAIFFPIGLPPKGTCEFATKGCLKYCYAKHMDYPNYDEEVLVPEEDKRRIYEYFTETPIEQLCDRICYELDGLQTTILHWFGSGDCLTKDTDRTIEIIKTLPSVITQMGFTRNVRLWEQCKDVFALTVESSEAIGNREGMFAVPDYNEQTSVMVTSSYQVRGGFCGPIVCKDSKQKELEHYINCKTCRRLKTGCFDRRY